MAYSGNSMADQADKAYEDKEKCPDCKAFLKDVIYCTRNNRKCDSDCEILDDDTPDCKEASDGLECPRCGYCVEAE